MLKRTRDVVVCRKAEKAFVDVHKVTGLRRIYIACISSVRPRTQTYSTDDIKTVITFDKGLTWKAVMPPSVNSNAPPSCSHSDLCSLHFAQKFSEYVSYSTSVISAGSAPGYILATGNLGKKLGFRNNVYLSSNGGKNWKEVGFSMLTF